VASESEKKMMSTSCPMKKNRKNKKNMMSRTTTNAKMAMEIGARAQASEHFSKILAVLP
jgi:hypothetical protein